MEANVEAVCSSRSKINYSDYYNHNRSLGKQRKKETLAFAIARLH